MMHKLFYAVPLLITLFFVSCEQDDLDLNSLTSADLNIEPLAAQTNGNGFIGRIAISADGNDNDRDDIGATPMGLAIIAHLGLQNKLVHYDYNSHIWGNGSSGQKKDMTESAEGAASRFDFNKSVFISAIDETNKAERSIADAINNSSSGNPLYILVGGPMAVVCEGIRRSNQDKRKYVTVISHSKWNNEYSQNGSCTAADVKKTGVRFVQITDQNAGLHKRYDLWQWLKNHSNGKLRWVYQRMQASEKLNGDVSDAGMVWYLLKNDENVNIDKLEKFFSNGASTPDDGNGDSGSGSNDNSCQASGSTLAQAISNFEKSCGINYNKDKGHDCDPDGNGGWICSTGKASGGSGSSGGSNSPDNSDSGGGSSDNCKASGSTLAQAINNFEKSCGINYNKDKGHDCDPDGNGGWICSTGKVGGSGGSSGGSESPQSSSPSGGSSKCQAGGSTLAQAINNFEKSCGIQYNKSKGHDCDPDGKGGWICSTGDL